MELKKVLKLIKMPKKEKNPIQINGRILCETHGPPASPSWATWRKDQVSYVQITMAVLWLPWSVLSDPSVESRQDLPRGLLVFLGVKFSWVLMGIGVCSPIARFPQDEVRGQLPWGSAPSPGHPQAAIRMREAHPFMTEPCWGGRC